jgi:hypothetical protein
MAKPVEKTKKPVEAVGGRGKQRTEKPIKQQAAVPVK